MPDIDPREQPGRVSGMFGRIAGWYDFLNHFLSLGMDILWRKRLVDAVEPGATGRFLDLAAGTLDVTRELKRRHPRCRVLALDFARPMLEKGLPKIEGCKYDVQPVLADGRALPLAAQSVDGATIAFGIRNIRPREAAYAEILRVLAPGGRLAILEFGSSRRPIWKGVYNFYLHRLLPLVGRVVSGDATAYSYLAETIADFPTATELEDELRAAGFVNVSHRPMLSGIVNIHVGERRRFEGDTFVVGAARAETAGPGPARPAAPRPAPRPAAPAAAKAEPASAVAESAPEPCGVETAAANTASGLKAMEAALAAQPKQAPAKAPKAKAATAKTRKAPAKKANTADVKKGAPKADKKNPATGKAKAKKSAKKAAAPKAATTKKSAPKKAGGKG
jgi:demethylmenaquinone methyltransferase/2-methoxy-6-polyprenyl-1,4-benzoquinol methylase